MKYKFLFDEVPKRKCGAETTAILGVAAGFGSMLGGVISNENSISVSQAENQKNRDWQSKEAEKNRNFQAYQNEKARQWYSTEYARELQQSNEAAYQQWLKQQDVSYNYWMQQQQYNTPQAQVQRLRQAGFNPSAMGLQGSTYGGTGLSAAPASIGSPNVSVPSVPSGAQASPIGNSSFPVSADAMNAFSSIFDNISKSAKTSLEAKHTEDLLVSTIQNLVQDTKSKELANEFQDMENFIMSSTKDTKVKQAFQEYKNSVLQGYVSQSLGQKYDSEVCLNQAKELTEMLLQDKTSSEVAIAALELSNWQTKFDKQMEVLRTQAQANRGAAAAGYASSKLSLEQVATEKSKQFNLFADNVLKYAQANKVDAETDSQWLHNYITKLEIPEKYKNALLNEREIEMYLKNPTDITMHYLLDRINELKHTMNPTK